MRKLLIILTSFLLINGTYGNAIAVAPAKKASEIFLPIGNNGQKISLLELSKISMKDLEELSGKKMSFYEKIAYKSGQRSLRKSINKDGTIDKDFINKMTKAGKKSTSSPYASEGSMPKWAYILLVIIGLGFIPIGIMSNWTGNDWWISILLTLCFWLPGVIFGLIVMKKYY
jgi:uncharacterized membrane protein YqaE (UPF0057 family)